VKLASADVIHSFWVPNLFGKRDLVPGMDNVITFTPARVGRWRGQCAEFCGLQHARMALDVIVEPREEFERWRAQQLGTAEPAAVRGQEAGQAVFFARACNLCHTVRGTPAAGGVGPDLTHVASRRSIAAGATTTTRDALARWIANPHAIKPGVHMPATSLPSGELDALVGFLEGLK
jgi:cytochrome c oxidase subunit 2